MPRAAIGFSRTSGIVSRFIRWFTGSEVSHTWILIEAFGGQFVLESEIRGFRLVSWEHFHARNEVVYLHKVDPPQGRIESIASFLGDSYDIGQLLRILLRPILGWRRCSTPRQLLCSEAVVRFMPEIFPDVDPEWATPGTLLARLQARA